MLKPLLVLATFLLTCATAHAQKEKTPPEYKTIQRLTEERGSPHSYDVLFARFRAVDTTLTLAEYRLLYYGFFFRPEFSEDDGGTAMDSIRALYNRDTLTREDWQTVASFAKLAVDSAPYSLRAHKALFNAHRMLGDSQKFRHCMARRDGILDAIMSTGDGRTDSTAFHVASVGHEYDILGLFGLQSTRQSLTPTLCDYLELEENKYDLKGLYFDVSQLFELRQRTWFGGEGLKPPKASGGKKKQKR